ncbi:MAG: alpha-galactosidase [Spirochaetia bacterium]|nr:alpha-galactosidase [Spirochaetia bacterium]
MSKNILIKNERIEARFDPVRGMRLHALIDLASGKKIAVQDGQLLVSARDRVELTKAGVCKVTSVKEVPLRDPHMGPGKSLLAVLTLSLDGAKLTLKRRIDLPDGAGAIRILDLWSADQKISGLWYGDLIRLKLGGAKKGKVYDWFTCSDQTNHRLLGRSGKGRERGILYATDEVFIWKEGPAPDSRPIKGEFDFERKADILSVVGTGFDNLDPSAERRADAVVIGVTEDSDSLLGLRRWQSKRYFRKNLPDNVEWIANSWPAFHLDVNEEKILKEIDAAAESGFQVVTIDDGWFETFMGEVDPAKFPGGFRNLASRAKEKNVRVGLWMNPLGLDTRDERAKLWDGGECRDTVSEGNVWNWVARTPDFQPCETYISEGVRGYYGMDLCHPGYFSYLRDRVVALAKDHDLRRYKFDLYQLSAYNALTGDAHLHYEAYRRFLDELKKAGIVIEMDVTRSQRPCFDFGLDYGRLFLENRGRSLRDHRWYQPWISLANLWDAACLAPTQLLELEIFPQLDEYPLDYLLATAITANPLYFGALGEMPQAKLKNIRSFIEKNNSWRSRMLAGLVVPVGDRPAQNNWSGFASVTDKGEAGWLIGYKNGAKAPAKNAFDLRKLFPAHKKSSAEKVGGEGSCALSNGKVTLQIEAEYGWMAVEIRS